MCDDCVFFFQLYGRRPSGDTQLEVGASEFVCPGFIQIPRALFFGLWLDGGSTPGENTMDPSGAYGGRYNGRQHDLIQRHGQHFLCIDGVFGQLSRLFFPHRALIPYHYRFYYFSCFSFYSLVWNGIIIMRKSFTYHPCRLHQIGQIGGLFAFPIYHEDRGLGG